MRSGDYPSDPITFLASVISAGLHSHLHTSRPPQQPEYQTVAGLYQPSGSARNEQPPLPTPVNGISDGWTMNLITQLLANSLQQPMASEYPRALAKQFDTLAGSSADDEEILLDTLISRKAKGLTVRVALESLHGVNNHAAGSWKDYYLEHQDRLLTRIADRKALDSRESTPEQVDSGMQKYASRVKYSSSTPEAINRPRKRGPPYSQGFAAISENRKWRAHYRDGRSISPPPSRSPTPPTEVVKANVLGMNRYTEEDERFLVKSIQWQLLRDPYRQMGELAQVLADKAPHHSYESWKSHLRKARRELVETLIGAAQKRHPQGVDPADNSSDSEWDEDDGSSFRDMDIRPTKRKLEEVDDTELTSSKYRKTF